MKTVKISDVTGVVLDFLVAKARGADPEIFQYGGLPALRFENKMYCPSTLWAQGGPIIEMEGIELLCNLTATQAARFACVAHAD